MPGAELGSDRGTAQKLADLAAMPLVVAGHGVEHITIVLSAKRLDKRRDSPGRDHVHPFITGDPGAEEGADTLGWPSGRM